MGVGVGKNNSITVLRSSFLGYSISYVYFANIFSKPPNRRESKSKMDYDESEQKTLMSNTSPRTQEDNNRMKMICSRPQRIGVLISI